MGDINERVNVGTGMVVRCGDYVLLGKRATGKHGAGQWSLPGGKPDPGEHPLDSAVRETAEETGIILNSQTVDTIPFWSYERFPAYEMHYVTLYFRVEVDPNAAAMVRNVEPDKCLGWRWVKVLPEWNHGGYLDLPKQWVTTDQFGEQGYYEREPTFGAIETLAAKGLL